MEPTISMPNNATLGPNARLLKRAAKSALPRLSALSPPHAAGFMNWLYCFEGLCGSTRQTMWPFFEVVVERVVVWKILNKDMGTCLKPSRLVKRASGDANGWLIVGIPKQACTASRTKTAARYGRGFVPT